MGEETRFLDRTVSWMERLRSTVEDADGPRRVSGTRRRGPGLFVHRVFSIERVARIVFPHPIVGVVLRGTKEFWLGSGGRRLGTGAIFVVPAGIAFDVVNIPDERTGRYVSLFIEVTRVPRELTATGPRDNARVLDPEVPATPELVEALIHAATALGDPARASSVAEYRLAEILALLRDAPAARPLFDASLSERVALLILGDPARRWTAQDIGRELGLGASTLRRHLTKGGTSLRKILHETRMDVARDVLENGRGNVQEATLAAGYVSRSHFARRFQSVHGATPRRFRAR